VAGFFGNQASSFSSATKQGLQARKQGLRQPSKVFGNEQGPHFLPTRPSGAVELELSLVQENNSTQSTRSLDRPRNGCRESAFVVFFGQNNEHSLTNR
jgi:hypothetical protein